MRPFVFMTLLAGEPTLAEALPRLVKLRQRHAASLETAPPHARVAALQVQAELDAEIQRLTRIVG